MGADINLTPISDKVTEILAVIQRYSDTLEEIEKSTHGIVFSYVLLNRIHPFAKNFEHIEEIIESSSQLKMFKNMVKDRVIYDKSLIDGRTVLEANDLKGHKESIHEILSICHELIELHLHKKDKNG